ncbi:hypothetical protein BD309DRAFT_488386 [Dichomitus squalens]|nr:hypothetical protein BD309DRAFT_488386 [Dichomitus squalens]
MRQTQACLHSGPSLAPPAVSRAASCSRRGLCGVPACRRARQSILAARRDPDTPRIYFRATTHDRDHTRSVRTDGSTSIDPMYVCIHLPRYHRSRSHTFSSFAHMKYVRVVFIREGRRD